MASPFEHTDGDTLIDHIVFGEQDIQPSSRLNQWRFGRSSGGYRGADRGSPWRSQIAEAKQAGEMEGAARADLALHPDVSSH